jgi:type IV secretion system protein VirD4
MTNYHELFSGIRRGRGPNDYGTHPVGYFEPVENVAQAESLRFNPDDPQGKIFLGVVNAEIKGQGAHERHAVGGTPIGIKPDSHIVTVAASRAGKGRSAILTNLQLSTHESSYVALDFKAEMTKATARHRQSLGHKIMVADPFETAGPEFRDLHTVINPLSALHPGSETLYEDAGVISESLVIPTGANDPHWHLAGTNLVDGVLMHVGTSPLAKYHNKRDLISVYQAILHDALMPHPTYKGKFVLQAEMESNPAADGAIIAIANTFYGKPARERDSVLSTVRHQLQFLGYRRMRRVLRGEQSFDLKRLKREPCTLYLCLPVSRMGTCNRWLRLIINQLLVAMEEEQTKPKYPVIAILEEFPVLQKMDRVKTAIGQIAGHDLLFHIVLQDLAQLQAIYKDDWQTFLGNTSVCQFFGNNDMATLEWIEKRLGTTTIISPSAKSPNYKAETESGETGNSWSHAAHPLMTATEIATIFGRFDPLLRQLIIQPQRRPIITQRVFVDKLAANLEAWHEERT